ncbi:hypothetical protein F0L74_05725 [Chitinophaga agrisoli]|uniref:PLAT/LH2 domain-containing protein n=1 Tax=Chitinophaga agrisoli TaxID=2607653 RepID=A0A5B2W4H7_9BACT|nr:hypothetical protein [Chitinophaga agrisoli]KAA2245456.1 hypothetical protein F0L74_05725 [Chitinophaga agrisoli]
MKKFNRSLFSVVALLASVVLLASCGKDKDNTPDFNTVKSAKFTITLSGATADDRASFIFASTTIDGNSTIWKVDGQVRQNEAGITLDQDDFGTGTKTFVVETTQAVPAISVGIQCLNFDANYTVSYKAEINGQVVNNDQNVTVTTAKDYTHDFNYK